MSSEPPWLRADRLGWSSPSAMLDVPVVAQQGASRHRSVAGTVASPRRHRAKSRPKRHAQPFRRRSRLRSAVRAAAALSALLIVIGTGLAWQTYRQVTSGVTQSGALDGQPTSTGGTQNILIMGLDSRLDEQGRALPTQIYDALHAGDDSVGGYNANVLMLVHIPGDGSKATAISIPRDDYVDLSGCVEAPCKGKIKEAYGRAFAQRRDALSASGVTDAAQLEQQSREAGRVAEIATVRNFLGGVSIDHFVEVTLVAFFQIAEVVAPIPVCLNEDTSDDFSGAHFRQGRQEIDASAAVAFVRQRRDPNTDLDFTDLDRDRRQQAFLVGLSHKLQQTDSLTNVSKLQGLIAVAKQNIAVDNDPDIPTLASTVAHLSGGNLAYYTLPIDHFGTTDDGEDVNIVDEDRIHGIVENLLDHGTPPGATSLPSTAQESPAGQDAATVLDVVNDSGHDGWAGRLEDIMAAQGFVRGTTDSGSAQQHSSVEYGPGAAPAADRLATLLGGVAVAADSELPANTVQAILGTTASEPDPAMQASDDSASRTAQPPVAPVPATGTGNNAPAPTDLSTMSGSDVPCVK